MWHIYKVKYNTCAVAQQRLHAPQCTKPPGRLQSCCSPRPCFHRICVLTGSKGSCQPMTAQLQQSWGPRSVQGRCAWHGTCNTNTVSMQCTCAVCLLCNSTCGLQLLAHIMNGKGITYQAPTAGATRSNTNKTRFLRHSTTLNTGYRTELTGCVCPGQSSALLSIALPC
jgi:hypothetical protein